MEHGQRFATDRLKHIVCFLFIFCKTISCHHFSLCQLNSAYKRFYPLVKFINPIVCLYNFIKFFAIFFRCEENK